jgi:hypothetical protein
MRYQVMALDSEIGTAMTIQNLGWQRSAAGGDPSATFTGVKVYMGLCAADELGATFDDNYIEGSRVLVYESASLTVDAGFSEWYTVDLDTPYWYNGNDNLVVEVQWLTGSGTQYYYKWETGAARSVKATSPAAPSGILSTTMSELQLTGTTSLDSATFAEVKCVFSPAGE